MAKATSSATNRSYLKKPTEVYDIHATMLHLLGLDHEKLSFYHNGIQREFTHGHLPFSRYLRKAGLLPKSHR